MQAKPRPSGCRKSPAWCRRSPTCRPAAFLRRVAPMRRTDACRNFPPTRRSGRGIGPRAGARTRSSETAMTDLAAAPADARKSADLAADADAPVLEVSDLEKHFVVRHGFFRSGAGQVRAVDGVSFAIAPHETLGLVGESGCGKSTVGRAVLRLIEPTAGTIRVDGRDITHLTKAQLRPYRPQMQIIFQDPFSSLDPRMSAGDIVAEPLRVHGLASGRALREQVASLFDRVGLRRAQMESFPHQFSGGQRQRIGIARALALKPKLIVADEPVSALDVSIQAQVLNLMADLQKQFGLTYLFISHAIPVIEHISTRIGVMYLGKLVEVGTSAQICAAPKHPYTQALLRAVPVPDPAARKQRVILGGDVPTPINPPSGCRFHTRCPVAVDRCKVEEPPLRSLEDGRDAACHLV